MGLEVLERDWQVLREDICWAKQGFEDALARVESGLTSMTEKMTSWQWVIHGDTRGYRRGAVRYLLRAGKLDKALKFALCGRGDIVVEKREGEGVRVVPRGCGCRFCPRCSRRSGHRFLKRVGGHLEGRAHGVISHFVLTQPVRREEGVGESRKRFEKAWKRWYVALRAAGMEAALLTQHVKPRATVGWHFHGHCIVEWKGGVDVEGATAKLERVWQAAAKEEEGREKELFCRRVCDAGEALGEGGLGGQGELWSEPVGAVQRVLQYAIRDVVQGCESWVHSLTTDEQVSEFAGVIDSAKLHRLFGSWRKAAVVVGATAECERSEEKKKDVGKGVEKGLSVWRVVMGVEKMVQDAREMDPTAMALLRRFQSESWNRGEVARRLGILTKSVLGLRRAG